MSTTTPRVPGPQTRINQRRVHEHLDRKLDELARLREDGVIGDEEYHAMLGALAGGAPIARGAGARPEPASTPAGSADGTPPPPPGAGRRTLLMTTLGVAGVAAALALTAGAFAILGGGAGADVERVPDATSVFGGAVDGPVNRLTASAEVTGRVLGGTGTPGEIAAVRRMAAQQIAVVTRARSALIDVPATGEQRRRLGTLLRASARHRLLLVNLARIDASRPRVTLERFPALVAAARGSVADYRQALRGVPGVSSAITTAGLADLQGLRQALTRQQERLDAAAAAEAQRRAEAAAAAAAEARRAREGGDATLGPVVSGFSAADLGGTIAVDATVCDRTPGAVNDFIYTLELRGPSFDSTVLSASQTRACNPVAFRLPDGYTSGVYTATLRIDNLTNRVSGTASTSLVIT